MDKKEKQILGVVLLLIGVGSIMYPLLTGYAIPLIGSPFFILIFIVVGLVFIFPGKGNKK